MRKARARRSLTSSRNLSNNAENFLPDQMGMGKLGRYLRRLSSPRIRFLRKSRQSKPDPTRLFHNLLVAKLGGGPLRSARALRAEGKEMRSGWIRSFVRRRHKDRGACTGRVRGEEGGKQVIFLEEKFRSASTGREERSRENFWFVEQGEARDLGRTS